jgi:hypothetical protein
MSIVRLPAPFRVWATMAALVPVAWLSGCMHPAANDPARTGPFFTPANTSGDPTLGGIRRVVLLPAWVGEGTRPESAAELDPVFLHALQGTKRFEVVTLSREECRRRFRAEALSSAAALPSDLFSTLQREYAADAVLFVDLTTYQPYQPILLGLRGKLAAIDGTRLIWTFDNTFSSEAPAAANSARNHFLDRDRSVPADLTRTALQSPSRFAAYAAAAMFGTLPPVTLPPKGITK